MEYVLDLPIVTPKELAIAPTLVYEPLIVLVTLKLYPLALDKVIVPGPFPEDPLLQSP